MGPRAHPDHREYLGLLASHEMLHHAHEELCFRVPHQTHETEPSVHPRPDGERKDRAVAVASNFGGPPSHRWDDIRRRNAFFTFPELDLFGPRWAWRHYRPRHPWWPLGRTPANYRGPIGELGDYDAKLELMSGYTVTVCMENTVEPWYFSEKFVDAVRAGCIPIYHAHPTVAEGILAGALWVDPSDFGFDPEAAIAHARCLSRREVAERNGEWLQSEAVRATSRSGVFTRIVEALRCQPSH